MAKNAPRPGRALVVFLLVVVAMYGGLALNGVWTPKLGLDLQGGTRITLTAKTVSGESITTEKLAEARQIIDSRVNGSGVSESEVSTQGSSNIVVEIPGEPRPDIAESVSQTAQLRFRLVAAQAAPAGPLPSEGASPSDGAQPGEGAQPGDEPTPSPSATGNDRKNDGKNNGAGTNNKQQGNPQGSANRVLSDGLLAADAAAIAAGGATPTPGEPTAQPTPDQPAPDQPAPEQPAPDQPAPDQPAPDQPAQEQTPTPVSEIPTNKSSVAELIAWTRSPDLRSQSAFQAFTCDQTEEDVAAKPLLACDEQGQRYLLSPAVIEGTQLADAGFGIPQNDVAYAVNLDLKGGPATRAFTDVTRAYAGTGELFAIVLDAEVLSAPQVITPITDGNAQITGDFTQQEAQGLSNSLKYGALPLTFENSNTTLEGPTLASDQLSAGLIAGAVGLTLVLIYCMFYYRGLGLVVLASLGSAAAITYAAVLFLSENAGFTLTLPGIAGLIVAVGITADSFIVYFERIRDEMREGKSLRLAVEAGWIRARATCVAADAVSLLAAIVLYIFAIGVVKGFAFALGISTAIDLVVFFLFTKPLVTWLARLKFFASGHKMSGLSADHIGIERIGSTTLRPLEGSTR